jgi:plastocyanin
MKLSYLIVPIAGALIHSAAHFERQDLAARAATGAALASTDTATEGELPGTVILMGQPPKNRAIDMAADPQCVKSHAGPATSEEVVVGAGNALENVIVYVSEGLPTQTFKLPQQPVVIEQKGCQYHSHVVAMEAGQKLLVENSDPTTHNIHPLPANNREWNQSQAQGVPPIEATFGREEIAIPVKCNIHPWMKGYIAVFKHPYFAVTDRDGKFVLRGLPAGTYTITAWQEKLGELNQKVTVGPKEEKKVEFIFKTQSGG